MMTVNELYKLEDSDCEILYRMDSGELSVEVRQHQELRWLHINGVSIQSVYSIDSPVVIFNPVTAFMLCATSFTTEPKDILNIGLGGASIERYLLESLPDTAVHSVESSELIIHIAREFFELPYDYPVFNLSADDFIDNIEHKYDLILCDIFENELHPDCLLESQFYEHLCRILTVDGTFTINLLSDNEEELIEILKAIRMHFPHTFLVKIEAHNNVVVFARKNHISVDTDAIQSSFQQFLSSPFIQAFPFQWELHSLPDKPHA